jgi:hypothetical protein
MAPVVARPLATSGMFRPLLVFAVQHPTLLVAVVLVAVPNMLWSLGVLPVAGVATALAAHFVTWPVVRALQMRLVHSVLHHDLIGSKKVLGGLGAVLILVAFGRSSRVLGTWVLHVLGVPAGR